MNTDQRKVLRWTLILFGGGCLLWPIVVGGRLFNLDGLPIAVGLFAAAQFVWAGREKQSPILPRKRPAASQEANARRPQDEGH